MQSFVFGDQASGVKAIIFFIALISWFILDYFFIHKTQYSIHRIIGLSDKKYKLICLTFIFLGIILVCSFYTAFFKIDFLDNKIKLHYIPPRLPQTISSGQVKSYKIKILPDKNYKVLYIITTKGKAYRSEGIEPKYHDQLNRITAFLEEKGVRPQP